MQFPNLLDIKHLQNLGVLVELLLVFPVLLEEEPIDLDRELSETCAVEVECSPPPKFGEDGTENPT